MLLFCVNLVNRIGWFYIICYNVVYVINLDFFIGIEIRINIVKKLGW